MRLLLTIYAVIQFGNCKWPEQTFCCCCCCCYCYHYFYDDDDDDHHHHYHLHHHYDDDDEDAEAPPPTKNGFTMSRFFSITPMVMQQVTVPVAMDVPVLQQHSISFLGQPLKAS